MAVDRIYGAFQKAGLKVTTAAKSQVNSQGTDAYAMLVALVDGSGGLVGGGSEYETVAASQTAQVLGTTGAVGDYLAGLIIVPATTTPGVVTILDGATSISIFVGGAGSVSNLVPFPIPVGAKCVGAGWSVTTGANVSVIAVGNFT